MSYYLLLAGAIITEVVATVSLSPTSLWSNIETAWNRWRGLGAPAWHEFGLTATSAEHPRPTRWTALESSHPDARDTGMSESLPLDPEVRRELLDRRDRAVAEGTASARDLAYLRDRVNMHHDRRQTHGTQHTAYGGGRIRLWPVTDLDTLNQRRDALGIPPVDAATIADAWTPAELAQHGHHLADPAI